MGVPPHYSLASNLYLNMASLTSLASSDIFLSQHNIEMVLALLHSMPA